MEELQKHVETLRKEGASLKQQINQLQSDKDRNKAAMEKNTAEESRGLPVCWCGIMRFVI